MQCYFRTKYDEGQFYGESSSLARQRLFRITRFSCCCQLSLKGQSIHPPPTPPPKLQLAHADSFPIGERGSFSNPVILNSHTNTAVLKLQIFQDNLLAGSWKQKLWNVECITCATRKFRGSRISLHPYDLTIVLKVSLVILQSWVHADN